MSDKKLILVDASYTSFYRYFATLRWMSLSNPDEYKLHKDDKNYDWSQNKVFINKYEQMYLDSIIKLIKKKTMKDAIVIFCMDAPRNTLWRNKIHETYKEGRIDLSLKSNFKPTFQYTYDHIIPNIVKNNNMYSLQVPNLEADDIIACITLHVKHNIIIISGDTDFLQLGNENIQFINYKSKKFLEITSNDAIEYLNKKIILGDKSDNIPGIMTLRKFNTFKSKDILDYIKNDEKLYKLYLYNRSIIDFNYIPKEYYNKIITEFMKLKLK